MENEKPAMTFRVSAIISGLAILFSFGVRAQGAHTPNGCPHIPRKNAVVDYAQTFRVEIARYGALCFYPIKDTKTGELVFELRKGGKLFQVLRDYPISDADSNCKTVAVSFKDMNGDGLRDITIIAQCPGKDNKKTGRRESEIFLNGGDAKHGAPFASFGLLGAAFDAFQNLAEIEKFLDGNLDTRVIAEDTKNYEIRVIYPVTGKPRADKIIVSFARENLKSFMAGDIGPPEENLGKSSFDIDFEMKYTSGNFISAMFAVTNYHTGALHPDIFIYGLNIDAARGKRLRLKDLFTPGSDYLKRLSGIAIEDIMDQAREQTEDELSDDAIEWIKSGAGPTEQNLGQFVVTPDGLTFYFSPEQTGGYVEGTREVEIPLDKIRDIYINPIK
jgi:hypothetical protein